jgi:hypothetical protein
MLVVLLAHMRCEKVVAGIGLGIVFFVAVAALGCIVYEVVKAHGSLSTALADVKADLAKAEATVETLITAPKKAAYKALKPMFCKRIRPRAPRASDRNKYPARFTVGTIWPGVQCGHIVRADLGPSSVLECCFGEDSDSVAMETAEATGFCAPASHICLGQRLQLLRREDRAVFADVHRPDVASPALADAAFHAVFQSGVNVRRRKASLPEYGQ